MSALGLVVPEHIRADMEREQAIDRQIGAAHAVNNLIQAKYPDCELVWVGERTEVAGLTPARWHVWRQGGRDQGYMDAYIEWSGPNGEYLEPDSGILTMLARGDLWNRDVSAEFAKERRDAEERERKAQEALSAERIDLFATNIKSRLNPGISFSDARPWTNRVQKLPGK